MSHTLGLNSTHFTILPVTGTFIAPFALYNLWLQYRVVSNRLSTKQYHGDRLPSTTDETPSLGRDSLYRAVRAHANYIENVPLFLIAAALAELNGASRRVLTGVLTAYFVARVAHADLGLANEKTRGTGLGRIAGFYFSWVATPAVGLWAAYLCQNFWRPGKLH